MIQHKRVSYYAVTKTAKFNGYFCSRAKYTSSTYILTHARTHTQIYAQINKLRHTHTHNTLKYIGKSITYKMKHVITGACAIQTLHNICKAKGPITSAMYVIE